MSSIRRKLNGSNIRKTLAVYLITVMCIFASCMTAHAASARKKAMKAYRKMLSKGTVYLMPKNSAYRVWSEKKGMDISKKYKGNKARKIRFATAYLDNDAVPELILYDKQSGGEGVLGNSKYAIFTCSGKKIRRVVYGFGGSIPLGYYKKRSLIYRSIWNDMPTYSYERYSTGGLRQVCMKEDDWDGGWIYTDSYGYIISKNRFNSTISNITLGTKYTKFKFYKNTGSNRRKRLK